MDGEERRDAGIDAAQLHHDQSRADRGHGAASMLSHVVIADDIHRRDLGDQFERKLAPLPIGVDDRQDMFFIGVDDRQDMFFAEFAHVLQYLCLFRHQLLLHQEVIGAAGAPDIVEEIFRDGVRHRIPPYLLFEWPHLVVRRESNFAVPASSSARRRLMRSGRPDQARQRQNGDRLNFITPHQKWGIHSTLGTRN